LVGQITDGGFCADDPITPAEARAWAAALIEAADEVEAAIEREWVREEDDE
jgi:hypothetical protein